MSSIRGFPPLAHPDCKFLILGSMPGEASLAAGEYYAHPRNAFWPLLGTLLGFSPADSYARRCASLLSHGIAVWDVLSSCVRAGSLDSSITPASMVSNDFEGFFTGHPKLTRVFFNGGTAENLFNRLVLKKSPGGPAGLQYCKLPSTSPAHAALNFAQKLEIWRQNLDL